MGKKCQGQLSLRGRCLEKLLSEESTLKFDHWLIDNQDQRSEGLLGRFEGQDFGLNRSLWSLIPGRCVLGYQRGKS